jgi:hypothetical protein
MVLKVLAAIALGLLVARIFFREQLALLGKKLDRLVNVLILAMIITWIILALFQWIAT